MRPTLSKISLMAALYAVSSSMALAQNTPAAAAPQVSVPQIDKRVRKLEGEMRAVQRKVFPGGDARFFEPEVNTQAPADATAATPATSPFADLVSRVDALERQLQSITGQVEQNGYRVRQLEEQLNKMRGDTEFRLNVLEGKNPAAAPAAPAAPAAGGANEAPAAASASTSPAPTATQAPPAITPTPAPASAPAAAAKSKSAPAASEDVEAQWKAAYALVTAKDYARAEPALQAIIEKYPKHSRAASARFWLGRSYYEEKLYGKAAIEFLESYKRFPKELRGPDSLYWLGQSLMRLSPPSPKKACEAYGELEASYPDKASGAFKDRLARARAEAKCN